MPGLLAEFGGRDLLEAVHMGLDVVMGLGLFWIGSKARRFDRLEEELKRSANDLIEQKFSTIATEFNGHVRSFLAMIDDVKARLKDGDGELRDLVESDHAVELKLVNRIDELKDWLRVNSATRQDVKEHEHAVSLRIAKIEESLGRLAEKVAVLINRAGER